MEYLFQLPRRKKEDIRRWSTHCTALRIHCLLSEFESPCGIVVNKLSATKKNDTCYQTNLNVQRELKYVRVCFCLSTLNDLALSLLSISESDLERVEASFQSLIARPSNHCLTQEI